MITFVAASVAQNNFTNAVKGGVEAVKEGFSPLTNLLVKRDSAATNDKKTKSARTAGISFPPGNKLSRIRIPRRT